MATEPKAQLAQVRPYLVGEAVGTRGLEVQVGLEQLQEAAVDLLQKGHVWGYLRTRLGLSQDTSQPPSASQARKSFSKGHVCADGSATGAHRDGSRWAPRGSAQSSPGNSP